MYPIVSAIQNRRLTRLLNRSRSTRHWISLLPSFWLILNKPLTTQLIRCRICTLDHVRVSLGAPTSDPVRG
jgi:hypothetical protein